MSENLQKKISRFFEILRRIETFNHIEELLDWDQQVNLPSGGAAMRAEQTALIAKLAHESATAPELGDLIYELSGHPEINKNLFYCKNLAKAAKDYERNTKVPGDYVSMFSHAVGLGMGAWEEALKVADFGIFAPHLEKIVELQRQYSGFFAPSSHIYDPLLDMYEAGLTTAQVNALFGRLKKQQSELLRQIQSSGEYVSSPLPFKISPEQQKKLALWGADQLSFDWNRGRLDESTHPFTTTVGHHDIRITTNFKDENFNGLFSVLHETGHALYEQNIAPELYGSNLGRLDSLALHESQSRLWENIFGRSRGFCAKLHRQLQQLDPQWSAVTPEELYCRLNALQNTPIRVDADEVSYNLHIILRTELEIALLEQKISVNDLPRIWNQKMQDDLGIEVTDNAQGVLQDIHWACGNFGYFPTYALGNLISAQLFDAAMKDENVAADFEQGEADSLRQWLIENVHRHGSIYTSSEIVERITCGGIEAEPYLKYLSDKYNF